MKIPAPSQPGVRLHRASRARLLAGRKVLFGMVASQALAGLLATARSATYSLADDFSYTDNRTNSRWSFRLDGEADNSAAWPLVLSSTKRDANELWGSDFPMSPQMWSEGSGYWGIGKNRTGQEQFSSRNGTRWAPGEVMFHPKGGTAPAGLVISWTAPASMVIDVKYFFGRGSPHGNGIGYRVMRRVGGIDAEFAALKNIGNNLTNELTGLAVSKGDQVIFRFNTDGDPVGDITRAAITINDLPSVPIQATTVQPSGGTVTAGSEFTFSVQNSGGATLQWHKDRQPIRGATSAHYRIAGLKASDAGAYSVTVGSLTSGTATLKVTPKNLPPEPYPSLVPRQVFPQDLAEQEDALKTNELMLRFAASRKKLATDRYRPAYHFVSPESQMNDPNGLCFWQGHWHLFYQAYPPDEFPKASDIPKRRQHWGHAVSEDLVHWRDLPYAIYPGIERMCFSGSTVVESNQVIAFYPGIGAGQMVACSKDPLLLNWQKIEGNPVHAPSGDSCIWKEGETYFGLVGADRLVSSRNLLDWTVHGGFLEANPFPLGDAGACPGFVPIGNKHLLVCFSHTLGGQYRLGDYNAENHRFKPYAQGRFNHGTVSPGGVHAPSAAPDGRGGVINILNINDGKPSDDWDQIMSLAQRLSLGPDSQLRMAPVEATATLRNSQQQIGETVLPAHHEMILPGIEGDTLELDLEIDPKLARWVQLNVLRSPNAEEQTSITFYNYNRKLSVWYDTKAIVCLDGSRSSTSPDIWPRPPEEVVLEPEARDWASAPSATTPGKLLKMQVFIDRSVVEVFVEGKQYLAMRVYPSRPDSLGVSLRAQGQDAVLKKLDVWQMKAIWL